MPVRKYATTASWGALVIVTIVSQSIHADSSTPVPSDFPEFIVPGHDAEMATLRALYWLHYQPAGPLATMWDEWIPSPTLWPALESGNAMNTIRERWRNGFATRIMEPDGYGATHQHPSIAHQHGWPFPFWAQGGPGAWGWHFSLQGVPEGWHGTKEKTQEGWQITNARDDGIANHAWNLQLSGPRTTLQTPPLKIDAAQAPFMQLRWRATGLVDARPYLEWTTDDAPSFTPDRRVSFDPIDSPNVICTMIPAYNHPRWKGIITAIRIGFGNRRPGAAVGIQALFTQYDTRHTINNTSFVNGCARYFAWTRDVDFLRGQIHRIRTAALWSIDTCKGRESNSIIPPFPGRDGRSGLELQPDGTKTMHYGRGIGSNYWDLLPGGHYDGYATVQYYEMLRRLAELETQIAAHPEWCIPGRAVMPPARIEQHAAQVQAANGRFWNPVTKRFTFGVDIDGDLHDFGYTFVNLEAIACGYATPDQARDIMDWITGKRSVDGDTAQGNDIYHWRFAPRATTKRNVSFYFWAWNVAETIPWGYQVQDGGAVLGFSYHDLMSRLMVLGPDDVWNRLRQIVVWFDEVQKAGGYREYYKDPKRGTLQGGGPPGGLGMDREFFESILVPQIVIDGFLGLEPTADGMRLNPRLPKDWPELTVTRIHLHGLVLSVTARPGEIVIRKQAPSSEPIRIELPRGNWKMRYVDTTGRPTRSGEVRKTRDSTIAEVKWAGGDAFSLTSDK
jgi:hypothetical protein